MDISVVIPCYNSERYLRRCLDAQFAQTYPRDKYEVILVDNDSTDHSLRVAREYEELMVLEEKTPSSYAARNHGVSRAAGRILAFTDADCEVCPTWLDSIAAGLEKEEAALVLGGRHYAGESSGLSLIADYEEQRLEYICTLRKEALYFGFTNNLAVRREVFERCGPFLQLARGADTIFVASIIRTFGAEAMKYVPEARIDHLEINSVSEWYRKAAIYGKSYETYHACSRSETLSFKDRSRVLWRTITRNRYTWSQALCLMVLLACGLARYESGRILQRMSQKRVEKCQ